MDAVYNELGQTPLTVAATSPLGGATSVPPAAAITTTFARAVEPSSISYAVLDSANTPVPGAVSYDGASKKATFTPNQALASFTPVHGDSNRHGHHRRRHGGAGPVVVHDREAAGHTWRLPMHLV